MRALRECAPFHQLPSERLRGVFDKEPKRHGFLVNDIWALWPYRECHLGACLGSNAQCTN